MVICRRGNYALFPGQSTAKVALFLVLPATVLLFVSVVVTSVYMTEPGLSCTGIGALIKFSLSTEWKSESRSAQRLLKHLNKFGVFQLLFATLYIIFYTVLNVSDGCNPYSCTMWTVNIAAVGNSMFPWNGQLFIRAETATTILYVLLACGFYLVFLLYLGRFSQFGKDEHRAHARRVYDGLNSIADLRNCKSIEYRCLSRWAENALGVNGITDTEGRRSRHTAYLPPSDTFVLYPTPELSSLHPTMACC